MGSGGESREETLTRLVAANTRPIASDEERSVHRLILDAATDPAGQLTTTELDRVLRHIAGAGFDPLALERARGNITGVPRPRGGQVGTRDRLPPAEIHYLRHVIANREWPLGTTPEDYLTSVEVVVGDPASRVFVSRYQGTWQCGMIRESGVLRGPQGQAWIIVDYRLVTGFWATAFQWTHGPAGLADPVLDPRREALRWLK
jgi:hypothetical protein